MITSLGVVSKKLTGAFKIASRTSFLIAKTAPLRVQSRQYDLNTLSTAIIIETPISLPNEAYKALVSAYKALSFAHTPRV